MQTPIVTYVTYSLIIIFEKIAEQKNILENDIAQILLIVISMIGLW